jgi:hypothetical protein
VLGEIARRMGACLRQDDTIAHGENGNDAVEPVLSKPLASSSGWANWVRIRPGILLLPTSGSEGRPAISAAAGRAEKQRRGCEVGSPEPRPLSKAIQRRRQNQRQKQKQELQRRTGVSVPHKLARAISRGHDSTIFSCAAEAVEHSPCCKRHFRDGLLPLAFVAEE